MPELTLQRREVHVRTVRLEFAGDLGVLRLLTATARAMRPDLTIVARAMSQPLQLEGKIVTLPVSTLPAAQYCAVWSQKSALTANAQQFLSRLRQACQGYSW